MVDSESLSSGRQDTGYQTLHEFFSELLIRLVKWIMPKQVDHEHALVACPQ
jgi:hypothetical protein